MSEQKYPLGSLGDYKQFVDSRRGEEMSSEKPRIWISNHPMRTALWLKPHAFGVYEKPEFNNFTEYVPVSAFDKAVEALRNTECKCKPYRNIYGGIDTPPPCIRCKTLKDLGSGNG